MKDVSDPAASSSASRTALPSPRHTNAVSVRQSVFRTVVDADSQQDDTRARVVRFGRWAVVAMSVAMLILLGRTSQLQVDPLPAASQVAGAHRTASTMLSRRGALLDRQGRLMAVTSTATRLFVDSKLVVDPLTFPARVGRPLGLDPAWISERMGRRPDDRFIVLADQLTAEQVATVRELRLSGLAMEEHFVRRYPQGPLAGQVIGVVGTDGRGLEGLERQFNKQLTGSPGTLTLTRAASRRALWLEAAGYSPASPGEHIRLTLDAVIQNFAEEALSAACETYQAPSGQLIVIDPRDGAILAMANYPAFDPNHLRQSTAAQRRNRCVTDVFEPGSTFKTFIWATATQLGLADPEELIDCHHGLYVTPKGRRLRDAHAFDKLTWAEVLIRSSNIGMAIVGQRMGADRMHAAVRAFGFGQEIATGLAGEVPGLVQPLNRWTHYSVTSIPMGQEIAVTPLQVVCGMAIIANDGLTVSPTVLADVAALTRTHPIYERVLSAQAARQTRQVLRRAVTEGTGSRARSDSYTVFGKTGTAQVPDLVRGGYLDKQYVSSFVGGAPIDAPQIVVGCFIHVDEKASAYYGGTVAAPVVHDVVEKTLGYLGTPPDHGIPDERIAAALR